MSDTSQFWCKKTTQLTNTWSTSWDDWVPQDRVRKFTDENKELAAQLHAQMKALQQKSTPATGKAGTKKVTRANGSDFSSARGSEERHISTAAQSGRGPRRNRDYDLENVSTWAFVSLSLDLLCYCFWTMMAVTRWNIDLLAWSSRQF